ncbi:MAG: flagellar hook-associated protein FlgK [Spirochaetes bacterium]|nr:flagellar hook-associated protein FlgK [Spirochaetota bacterium]
MTSTFLGIEIGKRGVDVHQRGLQVTGQNITNADNEAYSRQRIHLTTMPALTDPSLNREERPGQLGQGPEIAAIRRDRDLYLDERSNTEVGYREYWKGVKDLTTRLEAVHNSLGEANLQARLDRFWSGWQEVAKNPAEPATRAALVQDGALLARGLQDSHRAFTGIRGELDQRIVSEVRTINTMAGNLAELNLRITQSEAAGDNPNDLMDERDRLVGELAKRVDIRTSNKDKDDFIVYIGGKILVQGGTTSLLRATGNPADEGLAAITWAVDGQPASFASGSLKALLETRDQVIPAQLRNLDALAANLIHSVNGLHREGFDLYGRRGQDFFIEKKAPADVFANADGNGDGIEDSSWIFQVTGTQKVNPDAIVGEGGVLSLSDRDGKRITLEYRADERISSVIQRINLAGANVGATLRADGRLLVKANTAESGPSFAINHLEDSGNFLVGVTGILKNSGEAGAYDRARVNEYRKLGGEMEASAMTPLGHPASWIAVNPHLVKDGGLVAAADGTDTSGRGKDRSNGPGDGTMALSVAALRHGEIQVDGRRTFNEYYTAMVENLGTRGFGAKMEVEKAEALTGHLDGMRKAISGVNLDEEMTRMLSYQHGYKAAARLISVMDEMLETLIVRMT